MPDRNLSLGSNQKPQSCEEAMLTATPSVCRTLKSVTYFAKIHIHAKQK